MKTNLSLFFLVLLLPIAATGQTTGKTPLAVQQAVSVRRLQDLRWSPEATRIAFTVTEPPKGPDPQKHIWVYMVASHELRQFTNSNKTESQPRWSPDGKYLAFLSDRDEFQQIYVMPADGGEAIRRTEGKRSVKSFEWSPDGKQIAYLAPPGKTEQEEKKEKDKEDARVADKDEKRAHLWTLDTVTWKDRELIGAPWEFDELQWTPKGDGLIAVATDHPESDQQTKRIFSITLADPKMNHLFAPNGPFANLRISPDGKWISYIGARVDGPSPHDLYLLSVNGGTPRNLSGQSLDRPIEAFVWGSERTLLTLSSEGFHSKFAIVDTSGRAEMLADPQMNVREFDAPAANMGRAPSPAKSSAQVAFVAETMAHPAELFMSDGKSAPLPVSRFNQMR